MIPRAVIGMCRDLVSLQSKANVDGYGNIQPGASASYRARVTYDSKRTYAGKNGVNIQSTIRVYLPYDLAVTTEWVVTLPDGSTPPIISVRRPAWADGRRHTEIYL